MQAINTSGRDEFGIGPSCFSGCDLWENEWLYTGMIEFTRGCALVYFVRQISQRSLDTIHYLSDVEMPIQYVEMYPDYSSAQ